MSKGYERVLAKYNRAKKHIDDCIAAIDVFRDANRDHVGVYANPQTGDVTYYVKSVPCVPDEIALVLGDAIHNLRSTLDYLACALVVAAGQTSCEHTGFPIFDEAKFYEHTAAAKVKGIGKHCKERIDLIQPYKGGNGHLLWQLNKLDIMDKHRLLLAVSFVPTGRTLMPSEREKFNVRFARIAAHPIVSLSVPHRWISDSPPPKIPLQAGQELLIVTAADAQQNMGFSFDVAIHEPGIVEAAPAYWFLNMVSGEVFRIVTDLAPWL